MLHIPTTILCPCSEKYIQLIHFRFTLFDETVVHHVVLLQLGLLDMCNVGQAKAKPFELHQKHSIKIYRDKPSATSCLSMLS